MTAAESRSRLSHIVAHVDAACAEPGLRLLEQHPALSEAPVVASSTLLQTRRITATVGAEACGVDLSQPLTPELAAAISDALTEHKVLVFRGQRAMQSEHQLRLVQALNWHWGLEPRSAQQQYSYEDGAFVIRFLGSKAGARNVWQVADADAAEATRASGAYARPLNPSGKAGSPSSPALRAEAAWPFSSQLRRRSPRLDNGAGSFFHRYGGTGSWVRHGHEQTFASNVWHSDDQYCLEPPWATTLHALALPSSGGDTLFADMALAYDDLDAKSQASLCGLSVLCDWRQVFPHYLEGTAETEELSIRYPRVAHPLVRTHPTTGRRTLFANAIYSVGLEGVDDDSGAALLRELFALPGVPEFQCRVQWQSPGDFIIWDNRAVQHYAVADFGGLPHGQRGRLMEHVASLGTRPFLQKDDGTVMESRFVDRLVGRCGAADGATLPG